MRPLPHRAAWLACLGLLALAGTASAATVKALRVGQHPSYTRIVFELDEAVGYSVERRSADDGTPLLIVSLQARLAEGAPQRLQSRSSLLESLVMTRLEERSVATVRLRKSGLPIKEMILRSPARIVLDVVGEDTALVQAAARTAAKAAPAEKPAPAAEPKPEPAPAAEPVAKPEPAPAPKPVAKPEPAPAPKPVAKAEPAPEVKPAPGRAVPSEPAEAAPGAAEADPEAERAAREAMERRLAAVREAAEKRQRQLQAEKEAQRAAEAEEGAEQAEAEPAPGPQADETQGPSPVLLGGAAGLALVLVVLLVALFRRRDPPKHVDVAAFDEELETPADAAAGGFEIGSTAEPLVGAAETSPPRPEPRVEAPEPVDLPEPEKEETGMQGQVQDAMSGRAPSPSPQGGADVTHLVAELERRISQLESGLEEANAARERLERQVVAQSEELRVQRAAIARTQRALRGMSRSDEEQATEPALRE